MFWNKDAPCAMVGMAWLQEGTDLTPSKGPRCQQVREKPRQWLLALPALGGASPKPLGSSQSNHNQQVLLSQFSPVTSMSSAATGSI